MESAETRTPTLEQLRIRQEFGKPVEELIAEWRLQRKTLEQIAAKLDVSLPTLKRWVIDLDLTAAGLARRADAKASGQPAEAAGEP